MRRVIVTGANGSGKSHLAYRLARLRPDIPVVSFDAIKLERDWHVRPRDVVVAELERVVATEAWILEGGPSLLAHAVPRADAVIWLDPPAMLRAWRLMIRPWRNFGKTRPELPEGNRDWPWSQYHFAFKSLIAGRRFRRKIKRQLSDNGDVTVLHCRTERDIESAVALWKSQDATLRVPMAS